MQIKILLHSKGFALSPVLKVSVSGPRKWPTHQAKKSEGPVCLTRALKNIYTYGFVKTPTAIVPLVK